MVVHTIFTVKCYPLRVGSYITKKVDLVANISAYEIG